MHAKVNTAAVHGIDAISVEIEIDVGRGLPGVTLLGLPDAGVKEGRDRVRAALLNSGYQFPAHKVTVNMAPAHVRKEGPAFDLPLALGMLSGTGQLPEPALARLRDYAAVGELALDGRLRPVRGALAMAIAAREAGRRGMLLPSENAAEAAAVDGLKAVPVGLLRDAVAFLASGSAAAQAEAVRAAPARPAGREEGLDMSDVRGQAAAKRALLVAAAGGHNLLFTGPPGAGKTMLAKRLATILPPLQPAEALEVTRIWSIAGLLSSGSGIMREPPFRAPHHTASAVALVGGGWPPRAGEVTLAHRGVLFLDELPEFGQRTLDTLREPLEEGRIRISRAKGTVEFPADFLFIAAMNPCPCGHGSDPRRPCKCGPLEVRRYQARVSGPLRDRFDIEVEVPPVGFAETRGPPSGPGSAELRRRVEAARGPQAARGKLNARLTNRELASWAALDRESEDIIRKAIEVRGLSARGIVRVLRVARTCADLEGSRRVRSEDVLEAVHYRLCDAPASAPVGEV